MLQSKSWCMTRFPHSRASALCLHMNILNDKFIALSTLLPLAFLLCFGCGGDEGPPPPPPPDTFNGEFRGTYSTSVQASTGFGLSLTQTGSTVRGTFTAPGGIERATINGNVSGTVLTFEATEETPQCPGSFVGVATLVPSVFGLTSGFFGQSCLGIQTNGLATATRVDAPDTLGPVSGGAPPLSVDLTGTWQGTYRTSRQPTTLITFIFLRETGPSPSGPVFTGSYNASQAPLSGTIRGFVREDVYTFGATQITPCPGTFSGSAKVAATSDSMTLTFVGLDCNGPQSDGQGMLTRQP